VGFEKESGLGARYWVYPAPELAAANDSPPAPPGASVPGIWRAAFYYPRAINLLLLVAAHTLWFSAPSQRLTRVEADKPGCSSAASRLTFKRRLTSKKVLGSANIARHWSFQWLSAMVLLTTVPILRWTWALSAEELVLYSVALVSVAGIRGRVWV